MKKVGIILVAIVVSLGLIVSIVMFNFYRVKVLPVVANNTQTKEHFTIPEKKDSIKVVTSIHITECEVVEVANAENKLHQASCDDGSKDGFSNQDIIDKQAHPTLRVGDIVIITRSEDGILNVRNEIE